MFYHVLSLDYLFKHNFNVIAIYIYIYIYINFRIINFFADINKCVLYLVKRGKAVPLHVLKSQRERTVLAALIHRLGIDGFIFMGA
jgi:hypothetical protein